MRLRSTALEAIEVGRQASPDRQRIGEILVGLSALRAEDVDTVLDRQNQTGKLLGETAVELGLVPPQAVETALEFQHRARPLSPEDDLIDKRLVAAFDPHGEFATSLKSVLLNLGPVLGEVNARTRILMVTGVDALLESALVAANLAIICAQAGYRVLLVDANIDHPIHNTLFKTSNRAGVTSLLGSTEVPHRAVQRTAVQNLALITTGPSQPNATSLLEREPLIHRILPVAREFDMVFVECGTLVQPLIARASIGAHGAILAVKEGQSSLRHLQKLVKLLEAHDVRHAGVVMMS